ncbi:MAG: hypothetical protein M3Z25_17320 [Actinomycetota bacterium]|nr:hypothetical protein [Actinomycetota bacterium]
MHSEEIEVRTGHTETVVDLTEQVSTFRRAHAGQDGLLRAWIPHATARLAVILPGGHQQ